MDEIYIFFYRQISQRISSDEHKHMNTQRNQIAWFSCADMKHLHLTLKANLTEEKQPRAQHQYFT